MNLELHLAVTGEVYADGKSDNRLKSESVFNPGYKVYVPRLFCAEISLVNMCCARGCDLGVGQHHSGLLIIKALFDTDDMSFRVA